MKKILTLFTIIAIFVSAAGCSAKDALYSKLQDEMWKQSGIEDYDESYGKYIKQKNNNQIDEEGHYIEPVVEAKGSVRITFFSNNNLTTNYYYDADRTLRVDTSNCYLNPGESLYADLPKVTNGKNNTYRFSRFEIHAYDEDNNKEQFTSSVNDGEILAIPSSFAGTHLSVMVLGEYTNKTLTFKSSFNGKPLGGNWSINGVDGYKESAIIDGSSSYGVTYDYKGYINDYYFYSSTPECYQADDLVGIVEFYNQDSLSNITSFEVELKHYKTLELTNANNGFLSSAHIKSLAINNDEVHEDFKKSTLSFNKIKEGDKIVIKVDKDYKLDQQNLEQTSIVTIDSEKANEYTFIVPETTEANLSIVCSKITATLGGYSQKQISNGTVTVLHPDGNIPVEIGEEVDDNQRVLVRISPYNDYYITGKDVSENVYEKTMKYKDYVSDIDSIISKHAIEKYITVTLDEQDDFGIVNYTLGKEMMSGKNKFKDGDVITCEYTLTDENYKLVSSGFWSNVWSKVFKTNKTSVEITIESSLNDKTIKRSDYIEIEHK